MKENKNKGLWIIVIIIIFIETIDPAHKTIVFNSLDWIWLHQWIVTFFNMIVTQIYRMDSEELEYSAHATIVILWCFCILFCNSIDQWKKFSHVDDGVYIPSKRCWGFLFQNGNVRVLAI